MLAFSLKKFKAFCKTAGLNYEENLCWANTLDGCKTFKRKGFYYCYDENNIKYMVDINWCERRKK